MRGSFQPQSPEAKVRATEIPRPLAKIRQLGGRLPARRQGRGLVPVAAQPSQDLLIEIDDRLVLPETLGIIGPRAQQMLLGSQVDTQQVHQAGRHGGPAAMHPEHADDTPSRRIDSIRPNPFDATIPRSSACGTTGHPAGSRADDFDGLMMCSNSIEPMINRLVGAATGGRSRTDRSRGTPPRRRRRGTPRNRHNARATRATGRG